MARKQVDPERRAEIGRERRALTRAKIVAAAFDVFGDADGLYAPIEAVADRAGVTRATFYNHFAGMAELRAALTWEVTHDFLLAVTDAIAQMPDARDRSASAVRFYLRRTRIDRRWGWSMINLSAAGLIFGAETFRQAEQTVREGVEDGVFPLSSPSWAAICYWGRRWPRWARSCAAARPRTIPRRSRATFSSL
ncbi:TetR/AcrR family transcriptional regulator [Sphingomonas sp. MMS24-J13]|uniref:TetR/AcrR family transcriptional regulator n=1 Tax=Sphingomonas sp. MMS24-J13 TaxID=3238686 RepID=UPI003850C59B